MRTLTSSWLIYLKAALFLTMGVGASLLVITEHPTLQTGASLVIAVWAFCRTYYFAFYVIQRYVDSTYRFSGLFSVAMYFWARRNATSGRRPHP